MEHDTQQIELVGGAKLLVINMPVAVSFSLDIYTRSGSWFAPLRQYEISHLLEHLSFEGNQLYPDPLAFKTEIERDGTYFNASTSSFFNQYRFVSLPGELERILEIGLAQVFQPILTAKAITHEKDTVTNELKGRREDFFNIRGYLASQVIFGQKLPSLDERISSLANISTRDLRRYHQTHYHPSNTRLVLSGHFKASEIDRAVSLINQTLEQQAKLEPTAFKPLQLEDFGRKIVPQQIPLKGQALFHMQFVQPGLDLASMPALWVLHSLYTGGFSSRMMIKARQAGLSYTFEAATSTDIDQTDFEFWDQTEPKKLMKLLELAINELGSLAHGDYSDGELERAIGYEVGSMRRSYQTPAAYAGWYGSDFAFGRQLISPERRIEELLNINRAAITQMAQKQFTKDNWALIVLGQKPETLATGISEVIDRAFS